MLTAKAFEGPAHGVEALGADEIVDEEAHEALLRLRELVAAVAEELLGLLVEERAEDGLVGLVLCKTRKGYKKGYLTNTTVLKIKKLKCRYRQCFGSGSGWIRIKIAAWIGIRIRM